MAQFPPITPISSTVGVPVNHSSRLSRGADVPDNTREQARDYSDLSPELLEFVRALQIALVDKRVRQQLQSIDNERPSKLESAYSAQQARRGIRSEVTSHPQLLAALVDSTDVAIVSETTNGILLSWNKGAEHMLGYSAAEMISNSRACLIPEFLKAEDAKVTRQVIDGKAPLNRET